MSRFISLPIFCVPVVAMIVYIAAGTDSDVTLFLSAIVACNIVSLTMMIIGIAAIVRDRSIKHDILSVHFVSCIAGMTAISFVCTLLAFECARNVLRKV